MTFFIERGQIAKGCEVSLMAQLGSLEDGKLFLSQLHETRAAWECLLEEFEGIVIIENFDRVRKSQRLQRLPRRQLWPQARQSWYRWPQRPE